MINLKTELIGISKGFALMLALVAIIYGLALNWWQTVILLILVNIIISVYTKTLNLKNLLKNSLYILVLTVFLRWLYTYGAIGVILGIGIICAFIIWRNWQKYIAAKHQIEASIWGMPLYKFKEKGKNVPKLEIKF